MLKNYIKIAWRNIIGNKGFSLINIFGLAVGLGICIVITLYVQDELSFDSFHANKDRIYQLDKGTEFAGSFRYGVSTSYAVGQMLVESFPSVDNKVRIIGPRKGQIRFDEIIIHEDGVTVADSTFFKVFSFPLIRGNPESVLSNPNSVVLSKRMAEKHFPGRSALGEVINIRGYNVENEYTVTGVAENPPTNTSFPFEFVIPVESLDQNYKETDVWGPGIYNTFVMLQPDTKPEPLMEQLIQAAEGYMKEGTEFRLIPLSDYYFNKSGSAEGFKGNRAYLYIFFAIALFVLLIACINYMNLATARISKRVREVGIRKTLGAGKKQIALQFLGEALIVSFVSFIISIGIAELLLPYFNEIFQKNLELKYADQKELIGGLLLLSFMAGLISGAYPSLYLSRFNPSRILGGHFGSISGSRFLRKSLVVTQFCISVILIVGTLVIFRQMEFVQQKNLGFEEEQLMVLNLPSSRQFETWKQELSQFPEVQNISAATSWPGSYGSYSGTNPDPNRPDFELSLHNIKTDGDYRETLGLKMLAGRYLSDERGTDSTLAVVLNETVVKKMNWTPHEAIGKDFNIYSDTYKVIGVVEDFHGESLREEIEPMMFRIKDTWDDRPEYYTVGIRFAPGEVSGLMSKVRNYWEQRAPNRPFSYFFIDQKFEEMYRSEQRLQSIFNIFAGVAILIACLGLLGLAAYTAERRTKEIGIRKVLGATVSNIVGLLSKDFIKLVVLGFIIAVPIAWYVMNRWLADFAYRIEIGPGIFALAGGAALFIALATVSWQSVRAALVNPVESLRNE